jgi:hypothetical protein
MTGGEGRARIWWHGPARILVATAATATVLLSLPSPTYAETQAQLLVTEGDVLQAFTGSGSLGVVQNSMRAPGAYNLFLLDSADNEVKVNRPGTEGYAGGIDGTTVIYVEWTKAASKLVFYDTATGSYTDLSITSTAKHPTLSGEWLLYEDGLRRQTSSVRLYNYVTHETRRLGFGNGSRRNVYAGQVAGDWATWGRVTPSGQDIYLTSIVTGQTVKLHRPSTVFAQYEPAVTSAGTVYFTRTKPCRQRCPNFNRPKARYQLIEQRLGGRPRVVANLPRGMDTGYLYAATDGSQTRVVYPRFSWLRGGDAGYGDLFGFTAPE